MCYFLMTALSKLIQPQTGNKSNACQQQDSHTVVSSHQGILYKDENERPSLTVHKNTMKLTNMRLSDKCQTDTKEHILHVSICMKF